MSDSETVLPQGAGYGVVVGIGLFFSAFMLGLTAIQARYTGFSLQNSEEFSSASRSVKPGLIASGIVSAWTWAATLLQSSAVAYKFGISGPWWYGSGATVVEEPEMLKWDPGATQGHLNKVRHVPSAKNNNYKSEKLYRSALSLDTC